MRTAVLSRKSDHRLLRLALGFIVTMLAVSGAAQTSGAPGHSSLPAGSWQFIVSGDSRNCGDIVMPTIAAKSAKVAPAFYWHLGDLRAIYKIDEDMAAAAKHSGQTLTCASYRRRAWDDFVEHQIAEKRRRVPAPV
jgi:hypothetical protein